MMERWKHAHTYDRSCEIIRTYLSLLGNEDLSPRSDEQVRHRGPRAPAEMTSGTTQPNLSTFSPPGDDSWTPFRDASASAPPPRFSRPRLHSPSTGRSATPGFGPRYGLDGDALDGEGGGSGSASKPRLACPQCQRTFSTVSNRNKHVREGCAHRQKNGYRCRHPHCTKVLTTKWYRNTHEQERCRYRPATTSHHASST
jgi:hypothetical protein